MTQTTDAKPIIVGVDGSESSIAALRLAAEMARALDAPLETICTWQYPGVLATSYPVSGPSPEDAVNAILDDALLVVFPGATPERFARTVLQGEAAASLVEASKRARMLVLGNRGHGGFVGLVLGSVSVSCAAHAHSPVLICRAHLSTS